jgi:hypothetical protein
LIWRAIEQAEGIRNVILTIRGGETEGRATSLFEMFRSLCYEDQVMANMTVMNIAVEVSIA